MKMQTITTSFGIYSDAKLEQKTACIIERLTGNEFFAEPTPTLVQVQAAFTVFTDARVAAAGFDRTKVALKNEARQVLEVLLSKLAMYVMNVALGNSAMLSTSGFTLRKPSEARYIANPGNVTIVNGITSGELIASVVGVKGAKSYVHELATELPTEATEWISTSTSRSKFTYTNLVPGKQYWVRVAVIGARQQVAYSPVATQYAQ